MGRERTSSGLPLPGGLGRPGDERAVLFMSLAGRAALGLAMACFIYIYFNAWRHIFLQPLWLYSAPSSSPFPRPLADGDAAAIASSDLESAAPSDSSSSLSVSLPSILLLVALHFPLAMFWWTYYLTSSVGPGYVPKDWVRVHSIFYFYYLLFI
jgi:hypothetical protein